MIEIGGKPILWPADWGSRVYLFSTELYERGDFGLNRAGNDFEVRALDIDVDAFRALGGEYIISAVRIDPANNDRLQLERLFRDSTSA